MGVAMFNRKERVDKSKLENKLVVARTTPEPIFDLSHCGISRIPEGVYSLCRVLLKQKLDVSFNYLQSIKGGGELKDLHLLQILDLSNNNFTSVPEGIDLLSNLLELHLNNNKIKLLSNSLCYIRKLRILNVSNNKILALPEILDELVSLEVLIAEGNPNLCRLPKNTCKMLNLRDIKIDSSNFIYPPPDIIEKGTFSIKTYIADDTGYTSIIENIEPTPELPMNCDITDAENQYKEALQQLEELKNQRTSKFLAADNELLMKQELEISNALKSNKQELLRELIENENEFARNLGEIHKSKELDRLKFIQQLRQAEEQANLTVDQLLLLKPTISPEEIEIVNDISSPLTESKKNDILKDMQKILEEETSKFNKYTEERDEAALSILKQESQIDDVISHLLQNEDIKRFSFITDLQENRDLQKAAVAILLQKGNNHNWTIIQEVKLIESHLANLTAIEINKRKNYTSEHLANLSETRTKLTALLINVLQQQEQHRIHLLDMLQKMENENKSFDNYWLIQYQELFKKMQTMQQHLDPVFLQMVLVANLFNYLPILAKLLNETTEIQNLHEKDLLALGITDETDQENALKVLRTYDHIKYKPSNMPASAPYLEEASAPKLSDNDSYADLNNTETECTVCLDKSSNIILIPCGHLCSCLGCSTTLELCPLCRSTIDQKIQVYK